MLVEEKSERCNLKRTWPAIAGSEDGEKGL